MPTIHRPSRRVAQIVGALLALLTAGIAVGVWRATPGATPVKATSAVAGPRPLTGPALEQALTIVAAGDETAPRDRWDPAYVAGLLGPDPKMHLRWVRERSVWVPYRGALRGAAGVLMDGQGNSLDRALLLATLLGRAGHTTRLAHGELSAEQAIRLLPALVDRRRRIAEGSRRVAPPGAWRGEVTQFTQAYDLDAASLTKTIGRRMDEVVRMHGTLETRTEEQTKRLSAALGARGDAGGREQTRRALADLRDHWWVQWQTPEGWADLDLLGDSQGRALVPAAGTVVQALDSALYHRVVVRLVTERLADGRLHETKALERGFRPMDVLGRSIMLQILPESWQPGLFDHVNDPAAGLRSMALEQETWYATLSLDKEAVAEAVLRRTGKADPPAGGGVFGGLGQGIAGALETRKPTGELSAVWIEYEVHRPGSSPLVVRRQLFDLVGPAARASTAPIALELDEARRLERSLALFRTTDILPIAGSIAPEYVTHLAAAATLANADLLRMAAPPPGSSSSALLELLNERGAVPPSPLYALAAVRLPADFGGDVYLDQPNILSQHEHLAVRDGEIVRLQATDIVANDVGVALDARNPMQARRRQGVRDTNAEALVHGRTVPASSVAETYAAPGRWVAVTSPDDRFLETLPPDTRQRMRDDLAAGYAILAPADAARATAPEATGWWRTDPRTGHTLGVSGTGWGQSAVEKAAIIMGAVAVGWTFEYLICSGSIPGIGQPAQKVARARPLLDWLVPPLHAATARQDLCIWEAWKAGIMAGAWQAVSVVWPLMLRMFPVLEFFDRPMFATGAAGSGGEGDPAPIFGGNPPAKPPPEKCPPGGAAPGAAEGAPPEGEAPAPGEGPPPEGEAPPKAPAEEPAPKVGAERENYPPIDGDDWAPMPPEEMAERVSSANAAAAEAGAKIAPARTRYAEAQAAVKEAEQEVEAAKAAAQTDQSLEATKRWTEAADALTKAQVKAYNAYRDLNTLEKAQQIADRTAGMQPLNDELYQARAQVQQTGKRFSDALQEGRADFNSEEYLAWKAASDRYTAAHKKFGAAQFEPLPPPPATPNAPASGTGGGTVAMPDRPLPGPGQTQPLQSPAGSPPAGTGAPPPAGGPGSTQPIGEGPTYPACPQGSSPPGSPPPGQPRPKWPLPGSPGGAPAGKAPAGKGPFQGDPDNRDWLRKNWSPNPRDAHDVAGALGDPAIYDNADAAALGRYTQARNQGLDDQAARQESWETWWNSVQDARRAAGIRLNPVSPGHEWVGPVPQGQVVVGTGAMAGSK
jgi:hypothetical protein